MKRSDEYFEWFRFDRDHHLGLGDVRLTMAEQEELIKQVQLDAIEETCKSILDTCAYVSYPLGDYERLCGEITTKQSILDCAEILKKEIE